jgi:Excalibur calcium-binding domain
MLRKIFLAVLLIAAGSYAYKRVAHPQSVPGPVAPVEYADEHADQPAAPVQSSFHCDGRTRCNEMTSCDEARYFLQNCPGVKMDGDGDGLPCEDWCGHHL